MSVGLVDSFRVKHPEAKEFSWWDYRMGGYKRNWGLRIDHIFTTAPLAARCTTCTIDRAARKGTNASDHAPVLAEFTGC